MSMLSSYKVLDKVFKNNFQPGKMNIETFFFRLF